MPNDTRSDSRPLRDVLREVEEELLDAARVNRRLNLPLGDALRLTQELRAVAPLLREAVEEMTCDGDPEYPIHCVPCDEDVDRNGELRAKLRALADELEAK